MGLNNPYKWPYAWVTGLIYNPYKWSYGPLLMTGDGAHFVDQVVLCQEMVQKSGNKKTPNWMVPKPVTVSNSGIELPINRARISSIKSIKTIYIGCGFSTILSIKNQMGPYQRTPK